MRIEFQTAYILHTRPYRDTSLLVDFFTPDIGRVSAVARGVRQRKGGKRSLFNPFCRLLVSLQGKHSLKLLTAIEADGAACFLTGQQLYSGFYLNELLVRLLPEMDAHPQLFAIYRETLQALQFDADLEPLLRCFEFSLLQELGYGVNFDHDAVSGEDILPDKNYWFDAQSGFFRCNTSLDATLHSTHVNYPAASGAEAPVFSGSDISAMARRDFSRMETRMVAKRLSRVLLRPLLGSRPLQSRELFKAPTG